MGGNDRRCVAVPCFFSFFFARSEDSRVFLLFSLLTLHHHAASSSVSATNEPFRYDLINTGREVLAQLAGPFGQNFTKISATTNATGQELQSVGDAYANLLDDIDELVATDQAFLLGPWLESAKSFATEYGVEDCGDTGYETITTCSKFYEWNARVQLTTWNPTPKSAVSIPSGPIDYASKHWSGLIKDYYAERVRRLTKLYVVQANAGKPIPSAAATDLLKAELAYEWTTATNEYPTTVVGDAVGMSKTMHDKYGVWFGSCGL